MITPLKSDNSLKSGTKKLEKDEDLARVNSMVENAPVNIMFADLNATIRYLNPASVKQLEAVQEHLPIKVADMVGSSYDVFHKNPAHQRQLLSDAKNLPHRAMIDVGPEKLDLLATATYDSNGKYIGPMITWSVGARPFRTSIQSPWSTPSSTSTRRAVFSPSFSSTT